MDSACVGPELAALKKRDSESLFDYFMRVDDALADTFASIHAVFYKGEAIEVHFNPASATVDADWNTFEDAGLCASLVRMKTPPEQGMRELGATAGAISSAERALCIGEEITRLHDAALLAMGDADEYRACRPANALAAMQAFVGAVDTHMPELERLAKETDGETKEQCATILASVERLRDAVDDLVQEALCDDARDELRVVIAEIQKRLH